MAEKPSQPKRVSKNIVTGIKVENGKLMVQQVTAAIETTGKEETISIPIPPEVAKKLFGGK